MATEIVATDEIATPEFMAAQDFQALLCEADVMELEECAKSFYPNRRIAYAYLARSKKELLEAANPPDDAAETYLNMLEHMKSFREHLMAQIEQVEIAQTRMLCVLATLCPKDDEVA